MKLLPNQKVKEITKMKKEGKSLRDIAKISGVSKATIIKYTSSIKPKKTVKKNGRPKKLSIEIENEVIGKFRESKCKNLVDGKILIMENHGISVCKQTIKNYLNASEVKCYVKQKKPLLTDIHKEKRLQFAMNYFNFSYFDWKNIIWSDESIFSLVNTNKKEYCWKKKSDELQDHHIKQTVKFGGKKIMVWGCLTAFGVGELILIDGNVNSESYIKILERGLITTIEKYNLDPKKVIFMQDNAPPHKAKITQEWLKRNKINVLDWPAQSPDLNPIENVWEIVDKRMRKADEQPKKCEELWKTVLNSWNNIDLDLIKDLYLSMGRRINCVIEKKGGYTKY